MKKVVTPIAILALTLSFGAGAAMIREKGEVIKVDARGLDLSTEQGQVTLYSRLRNAARQVCGETSIHGAGSLKRAMENRACVEESLTRAVESVGNQGLTEIHKTS